MTAPTPDAAPLPEKIAVDLAGLFNATEGTRSQWEKYLREDIQAVLARSAEQLRTLRIVMDGHIARADQAEAALARLRDRSEVRIERIAAVTHLSVDVVSGVLDALAEPPDA